MTDGLVNLRTAAKRLNMSKGTLDRYHREQIYDFPKPYTYSGRSPLFLWDALVEWREEQTVRVAETRQKAIRAAHIKSDIVIDTERLISLTEAAAICDVSRRTIKNWLREQPADAPKAYRYRKNYMLFAFNEIKPWIEKRLAETYETRCALAANAREGKDG